MNTDEAKSALKEAEDLVLKAVEFMADNHIGTSSGFDFLSRIETYDEVIFHVENLISYIENWEYENKLLQEKVNGVTDVPKSNFAVDKLDEAAERVSDALIMMYFDGVLDREVNATLEENFFSTLKVWREMNKA